MGGTEEEDGGGNRTEWNAGGFIGSTTSRQFPFSQERTVSRRPPLTEGGFIGSTSGQFPFSREQTLSRRYPLLLHLLLCHLIFYSLILLLLLHLSEDGADGVV